MASSLTVSTTIEDFSCDARLKILLGILRYWTLLIWGLFEVGMPTRPPWGRPCQTLKILAMHLVCWQLFLLPTITRLFAAMLGDLGISTLHSIKTMTQFSLFFFASNKPCRLLQCSRTTLRERLWRPLVFFVVPTYWETYFSSRRYSSYLFFSVSSLDHHTGHPAHHDAQILLYECVLDALWIFHRCFDLLEACFL
jgi:hypothetical protein